VEKGLTRFSKKVWQLFKRREAFTLSLLIIVLIISMSLSSSFRDLAYVLKSATRYMEYGMIALTMTLIIIAGMIDLSAPAIMVCTSTFVAMMFHGGMPLGWAIVAGLIIGVALGSFNGVLVAYLKLPAMIVTIGTLNAFRGISQIFIGDKSLGSFPDWFNSIEKIPVFKTANNAVFSITLLLFIVLAILFYFILHKTGFGRSIYAIGLNENAAKYSGVKTNRIKFILFVMSGLMCALAGMLTMSRLLLVRWDMATGGELEIVTMVLLGGTEITGGRGTMIGTFLAVLIVIILKTGLLVANVTANAQMFIMGLLLLISIIIPNIMNYYRSKHG
jgi:rhamnose transport system permease protein